jgi:serine/threonine-protein phosphatase PP1 catalytic subunit
MNDINQQNFVNFINHLLTFNKQMELFNNQGNCNNETPFRFNINSKVIIKLCDLVRPIFQKEMNILKLLAPVFVFGDIHGQFSDLIHFLEMTGLPPDNKFLFLGDYVDRGNNSIEVCALLFAMKIMFPNQVYMLRGNHECPEVNILYGLLGECESRYGSKEGKIVFNKINDVLCALPLCAVINEKIFCVHGGISPNLQTLEDINKINRFVNIPNSGLLCDLMWSDPANTREKWGINSRGVSCTYNADAVNGFLKTNKLQLLCRAHQLVSDGYKFFAIKNLLTVFSAPNYCGSCGNDGAVLKINENLSCSFIIIKPTNEKENNKNDKK